DCQRPFVAEAVASAEMNNLDVKEDRGVAASDANYRDESDLYMGDGDSFTMTLFMNEVIEYDVYSPCALITTNLRTAGGDPVTTTARVGKNVDAETIGTEYGKGASKGKVSTFTTEPITIEEGMTLSSGKEIAIETVEFRDFANVRDEAGNEVVSIVGGKPLDKALKIDTDAPYATDISAFQMGPNSDFYVRFKVSDAISGAGELYGTIMLYDAGRENGTGYAYQYAVTSDSAAPATGLTPDPWKAGGAGTPMRFMQTGEEQYLHVKLADGVDYDFLQLALDFNLKDYAGNAHVRTVTPLEGVVLDESAPAVTPGNVSRSYDAAGGTGTMEVSFTVSDLAGLESIAYLWADPNEAVTAETAGWTDIGGFDVAAKSFTASAAFTVASESSVEKALWVKAGDIVDNEGVACCGTYRYDLTGVQYALSYPSGVSLTAGLTMTYQLAHEEDGGGLSKDFIVIDVQKGDEPTHYVAVFGADEVVASSAFNPFNAPDVTWYEVPEGAIVSSDTALSYGSAEAVLKPSSTQKLRKICDSNDYALVYDSWDGVHKFNGVLNVSVYSGGESGITYTKTTSGLGSIFFTIDKNASRYAEEAFSINVYPYSDALFGFDIETDADQEIYTWRHARPWVYTGEPNDLGDGNSNWLNSTLEGYQVSFDIRANAGWEWALDDIDWSRSFIALMGTAGVPGGYDEYHGRQSYGNIANYEERRLCSIGSGLEQTITLPASDLYASGAWYNGIQLILARKSNPDYPFVKELMPKSEGYVSTEYMLDKTEPGSVVPGLLCYSPYTYFDSHGGCDISDAFPKMLIDYDPSKTIYVPASVGSVDMMFQVLDADGEPALRNSWDVGQYDVIAWNVTYPDKPMVHLYEDMDVSNGFCFKYDEEYGIRSIFYSGRDSGLHSLGFSMGGRMQYILSDSNIGSPLYIEPDVDNRIAVQVRYVNGRSSEITYLTIHPVTLALQGTVTASPEGRGDLNVVYGRPGELTVSYTPAEGENTLGLTFYCVQGVPHENGLGYVCFMDEEPVLMEQENDGSYTAVVPTEQASLYHCPLPYYGVYARDRFGNLTWAGTVGPLIVDADGAYAYADPYEVDVVDGRFEVEFVVGDDSLYLAPDPQLYMDLNFYFAPDEYNAFLGDEHASLPIRIYPCTGEVTSEIIDDGYDELEVKTYTNTVPVEANVLGIDEITTKLVYPMGGDYTMPELYVTVRGYISPYAEGLTDLELYLAATDCFSNSYGGDYAELHQVSATELRVTNAELVDSGSDKALKLTFSAPVRPSASWMCPNPSGYALEWTDAFPITCDGVWEISYSDPFGMVHEETVELTDVFGDYGIQLDFSTLEHTTEPVAVTATQAAGFASLGQPDLSESWGFAYGQKSLTIEAEENSTIRIFSFEPGQTAGYWYDDVADVLDIHVTNIVQPVPEATVWLYIGSLQNAFIAGSPEQPTGEIPGAVTVYYRTDREVSPSGPDSLVIRPGDAGDFSFAYYDAVSNADYTITGNLSDYGIVLAADPDAADYVDLEAPSIDHVAIWAMQGGVFSQANSFNGAADEAAITDAFSEDTTGWAQGYDLVLNASDYSKWKLLAFAAQPTEVSFTDTGDALDGVAIQANNVLLTEELAGDVYIVCVDNAAAETGAAADNFTCIKIPYSALRFDNQAPEIFHTDNSATDLYERVVYLRGTDDHTDASVIA
ncbi:MAG: hypothetical protein K5981_06230, partial [Clostridia bacterium]|nr:hypothetical protein [Clostridia bacterium]